MVAGTKPGSTSRPGETSSAPDPQPGAGTAKKKARPSAPPAGATAPGSAGGPSNQGSSRRQCRECLTLTPSKWYLHKTIEGAYTCDVCYRFYKNYQRYKRGPETDQRPADAAAKPTNVVGNAIASTSPSTAATSSKDAAAAATTSPPIETEPQPGASPSPAPSPRGDEEAQDVSEPAPADGGDAAGGRGTKRKQSGEQGPRQRRKMEVNAVDDGGTKTDNRKTDADGGLPASPTAAAAAATGTGSRPGADAATLQPLQRRAAAIAAAQGIQNCAAKGGLWAKAPTGREPAHAAPRPAKDTGGGGSTAAATGPSGNGDGAGASTRPSAPPTAPSKRAANPPAAPKRKCILCGNEESRRFVKHRQTPELGVTCERCDDYFRRHREYPPSGRTVGGARRISGPSGAGTSAPAATGRPAADETAEAASGKEEAAGLSTAKAPSPDDAAADKTAMKKEVSQQAGEAKKAATAGDTSAEGTAVVGPSVTAEPTGSKGKAGPAVEKGGVETYAGPPEGKAQGDVAQPKESEEAVSTGAGPTAGHDKEGETATRTNASNATVQDTREERGGAADEAVAVSGPAAEDGKAAVTPDEAAVADARQATTEAVPATGDSAAAGVAQSSAVPAGGTTSTAIDALADGIASGGTGPSEEGAKAAAQAEAAGIKPPTGVPAEATIPQESQAAVPDAVNAGPSNGDVRAAGADDKKDQAAGAGPGASVSEEPSTATVTVHGSEGKDAPSGAAATASTAGDAEGNNPTPSTSTVTMSNPIAAAADADATSGGPRGSNGGVQVKEKAADDVAGGDTATGELKGKAATEPEGAGKKKAPCGQRAAARRQMPPPQSAAPEGGKEQREVEEPGEGQRAQRKAAAAGVARMRQGMGGSAGGKTSGGGAAAAPSSAVGDGEGGRSCFACGSTTTQSGWRRHQGGIEGKVVCKRCYDWHYRHGTYERATPAQSRGSGGVRRPKKTIGATTAGETGNAPGASGDGSKAVGVQAQKTDPAAAASEAAGAAAPVSSDAVGDKTTHSAKAGVNGRPSSTSLTGRAGASATPAVADDGAVHEVPAASPPSRKRQRVAAVHAASAAATGAADTAPGMDAMDGAREAILSPRWRQVPMHAGEDAAMKGSGSAMAREAAFSPRQGGPVLLPCREAAEIWSPREALVNGSMHTSDDVHPDAANLQSHVEAFGITLARACEALVALEDRYGIRLLDIAAPATPPLPSPTPSSAPGLGSVEARDLPPPRSALRIFYERVCGSDVQLRSRHLADVIIRWLEVHAWRSPLALLLGSTATESGLERLAALNSIDAERKTTASDTARRDATRIVGASPSPQVRSQPSPARLRGAPASEPPPSTRMDPRGTPAAVDRFRGVVESLAMNMAQNLLGLVPTAAEAVGAAGKALAEAYTAAMPHLQNAAAAALNLVLRVQGAPSRLVLRLVAPGDPIPEPPQPPPPQQPTPAAGPDPGLWAEQRGVATTLPSVKLLAPAGPQTRAPSGTTTPPPSYAEGEGGMAGLSTAALVDCDAASSVTAVEWVYCSVAGDAVVGVSGAAGAVASLQGNSWSSEQEGATQANTGAASRGLDSQHLRPAHLLRSVYDGGIAQWPESNLVLVRQGRPATGAASPPAVAGSGMQDASPHMPMHSVAGEGHHLHAAGGTTDAFFAAGGAHCAVMWVVAPGVVRREVQTLSGSEGTIMATSAKTGMPSVVAADTYSVIPAMMPGQDVSLAGPQESLPLRADSDPAAVAAAAEAADAVCSAVAAALARGDQAQLLGAAEAAAKVVLQLVQAVTKKGVVLEAPRGAEGSLTRGEAGSENAGSVLPMMGSIAWQGEEPKPAPLAVLVEVPVVPALVVGCAASAALR